MINIDRPNHSVQVHPCCNTSIGFDCIMNIDLVNWNINKNTIRVTRNKQNILFRSVKHVDGIVTRC